MTRWACSYGNVGPRAAEIPRLGGINDLSIQSFPFSWWGLHVRWSTPPRQVTGQPVRVTRFSGVSFLLLWEPRTGVTRLTGVIKSLRQSPPNGTPEQYDSNRYKHTELCWRFRLWNSKTLLKLTIPANRNQLRFYLLPRHWSEKQLHRNKGKQTLVISLLRVLWPCECIFWPPRGCMWVAVFLYCRWVRYLTSPWYPASM